MKNAGAPRPRTRQVHLDFHTSEHVSGVGEKFDPATWKERLRDARVNQINVFAKCHHSWSYYPTELGRAHPELSFDLLGSQLKACREIGVFSPIYYTVGWSAGDAELHPSWCVRNPDGSFHVADRPGGRWNHDAAPDDQKPWGWKWLCAAADGPYHRNILSEVEEICRRYEVDGMFFDIYADHACHCDTCRARNRAAGIDPRDADAVTVSYVEAIRRHTEEVKALILRFHPAATVFFNGIPHVGGRHYFRRRLFDVNTHQDLEDLPTVWGGYDKLPIEAKYHLGQGSRVVAMSGKFHKAWGEFGGFKHPDAITYEAAAMIAQGAACNFGDHMHPCGELDRQTYRNLGQAYRYVESVEAYGPGGVPCSRLGVWLGLDEEADQGLATLLLELHRDFVIADETNLDGLRALLLPSEPCLTETQAEKIRAWQESGGSLLVLGAGGLDQGRTKFLFDLGVGDPEENPFHFDYTSLGPALSGDLVETPFLNYRPGLRTRLRGGDALAFLRDPQFNRTYGRYCGHANTPYELTDSPHPAVVRHGRAFWFAHALDRFYLQDGMRLHRDLFAKVLALVEPEPFLSVKGLPSGARVNVLRQNEENRHVVHLLYAPVLQRGSVKVIEDFPELHDVEVTLRLDAPPAEILQVPQQKILPVKNGVVTIPAFSMHTALVFPD